MGVKETKIYYKDLVKNYPLKIKEEKNERFQKKSHSNPFDYDYGASRNRSDTIHCKRSRRDG